MSDEGHRLPDEVQRKIVLVLDTKRRVDEIVLRDQATIERLAGMGIGGVQLGGCPTIFLDEMSHRIPQLKDPDLGGTLVSIRSPSLMNIPLRHQVRVREHIIQIVRRGWTSFPGVSFHELNCNVF